VCILSVLTEVLWRTDQDGKLANLIQMERCGVNLEQYILALKQAHCQITINEYLMIITDILSGLSFLHQNHLIHQNIKFANSKYVTLRSH
jgi:serine/threonine protein kinase